MTRIGFDVDGILANFIPEYQALFVSTTGRDAFQPGDNVNPPSWDWPTLRGYTDEETAHVWSLINANPRFWRDIGELDGASTLAMCIADLEAKHEIYFVTARPGLRPKEQTEEWLREHIGLDSPTVLISKHKGLVCKALNLDAYLDDNLGNCRDVFVESPKTRCYLLNRNYNQSIELLPPSVTRVRSLGQMLDYEVIDHNL